MIPLTTIMSSFLLLPPRNLLFTNTRYVMVASTDFLTCIELEGYLYTASDASCLFT